jgi:DNA topoisomerase I
VTLPVDAAQDMRQVARSAGLRYVSDTMPGIRRVRSGHGFRYIGPDGQTIRDPAQLERIKALGIPPAWTRVWICPFPNGHIQAIGYDAKGRKQYRYHTRWREVRDETKYGRMVAFGEALSTIRERIAHDLVLPGLPREKVLATVVALLDMTHLRIGNQEYAQENESYGLTTLRNNHVAVSGSTIRLQFRGKAGKEHVIDVRDRRLARIIKRCQELPGQEIFQYLDGEGQLHPINSDDVNEYLQEITGQEFTAKDFRTWAGTVVATCALKEAGTFESDTQARKNVVGAIKVAAAHLGNTPAICRKSYVHPAVVDAYLDGTLLVQPEPNGAQPASMAALRQEEVDVLRFLRRLAPQAWDDPRRRRSKRRQQAQAATTDRGAA